MAWLYLIISGLLEVVGVTAIKGIVRGDRLSGIIKVTLSFSFSLFLLNLAMREIDLGIAYAVFTGIGAVGASLMGMIFWQESHRPIRLFYLLLIIGSVLGLKLASS